MELQFGKKRIGCSGSGTVLVLLLGVALVGSSYLFLGPGASEARGFVEALRHGDAQATEELADPSLHARVRRAFLERRMDEPIASLAGGDGFHSWHVSFRKNERCFRFTGQADREIFVTVAKTVEGWKVTQVSFYERDSEVCGAN